MQGRLRAVFRARAGRTYLAESHIQSPLKILRHFQLRDGRAVLQILQTTPGIFAGDSYKIELEAEPGAAVIVMSPSAAKLHRMAEGEFATQQIRICVHEGAHLEFYPAVNIPFPDADFRQDLQVDIAPGAHLAMMESWAMGRVERGEHLRFRRLSARAAVNLDGRPLYRDALELEPAVGLANAGWGILEGGRYAASGYWYGVAEEPPTPAPSSLDSVVAFGSPEPGQHYFRGLFQDSVEMGHAMSGVIGLMCRSWTLPDPPLTWFSS